MLPTLSLSVQPSCVQPSLASLLCPEVHLSDPDATSENKADGLPEIPPTVSPVLIRRRSEVVL